MRKPSIPKNIRLQKEQLTILSAVSLQPTHRGWTIDCHSSKEDNLPQILKKHVFAFNLPQVCKIQKSLAQERTLSGCVRGEEL